MTDQFWDTAKDLIAVSVLPVLLLLAAASLYPGFDVDQWDNFETSSIATTYAHDFWLSGNVPHWNPHQLMGEPIMGTMQAAPLYPYYTAIWASMRLFGIPVEQFPLLALMFHSACAAAGWYILLAWVGIDRRIRFLTALATSLCGYSVALSAQFLYVGATLAWAPWALAGVIRCAGERAARAPVALLAISLASLMTLGFPQLAVCTWLMVGIFALFWTWLVGKQRRGLLRVTFGFLVGAMLSAPAWLPGFSFFKNTDRSVPWDRSEYESMSIRPILSGLDWLLPSYIYPTGIFSVQSIYGYQGAWMIPALAAGLFLAYKTRTGSDTSGTKALYPMLWAALATAAPFYILAMGKYAGVTRILHGLPIWSSFRWPFRFLVQFLPCFAFAAAIGLDLTWRSASKFHHYLRSLSVLIPAAALLVWVANLVVYRKLRNSLWAGRSYQQPDWILNGLLTLCGLCVMCLILTRARWRLNFGLSALMSLLLIIYNNKEVKKKYVHGSMRISSVELSLNNDYRFLPASNYAPPPTFYTPKPTVQMAEYGLFYTATLNGLYSATGSSAPGLLPRWYYSWLPANGLGDLGDGVENYEILGTNLLRSFNTRYVLVAKTDTAKISLINSLGAYRKVKELDEVDVYEDAEALQRVYMATGTRSWDLDGFRRDMLVKNGVPSTLAHGEGLENRDFPGSAQIRSVTWVRNGARISLSPGQRSFVVAAVTWYPGWSAYANGEPLKVHLVNGTLVGLDIPPGTKEVNLAYTTAGFTAGMLLCAGGALALFFYAATGRAGRRRSMEATQ